MIKNSEKVFKEIKIMEICQSLGLRTYEPRVVSIPKGTIRIMLIQVN